MHYMIQSVEIPRFLITVNRKATLKFPFNGKWKILHTKRQTIWHCFCYMYVQLKSKSIMQIKIWQTSTIYLVLFHFHSTSPSPTQGQRIEKKRIEIDKMKKKNGTQHAFRSGHITCNAKTSIIINFMLIGHILHSTSLTNHPYNGCIYLL